MIESQTSPTLLEVQEYQLCCISPAPENDQLYRAINPDDPEIRELARSISERGVLEPLVISVDGFILSGHRRFTAARLAGLDRIPCRVVDVSRGDDRDAFVKLLREYNRQRVKSLDEVVREAIVDTDPEQAHERLLSHRATKSRVYYPKLHMGDRKARKRISAAKQLMLSAIIAIVFSLRDHWPISERKIHYKLLSNPPLRHASKPNSHYQNDRKSNADLSDLVTRARIEGLIPWEAIGDETRPVVTWDTHRSPAWFVQRELNGFLHGYWRDLQQSQPNWVELVSEKNTAAGDIQPVASKYCIPMTSGRGYSSLPPRYAMAQRFERSGAEKLIIIIVSDFDPDGERIAESFGRSMRDDFGLEVHPIKATLTHQQTIDFGLKFGMDVEAKSSKNKAWFQRRYGKDAKAFEVDALETDHLQRIVEDVICSVIDVDAFNHEVEAEKRDAAYLECLRERAMRLIGDIELDEEDEV